MDAFIVGNSHFPDALTTAYGWQPLPGAEREVRKVNTHLSNVKYKEYRDSYIDVRSYEHKNV